MNIKKIVTQKITNGTRVAMAILLLVVSMTMNMPQTAQAAEAMSKELPGFSAHSSLIVWDDGNTSLLHKLFNKDIAFTPPADERKVVKTMTVDATAYSSSVEQCDDTPCITANGFNVCEHGIEDTIAANFLKFNTKIRLPEIYGDKIFVVRDRMNARYTQRIDLWKTSRDSAIAFGYKRVKIEVLE